MTDPNHIRCCWCGRIGCAKPQCRVNHHNAMFIYPKVAPKLHPLAK